MTKRRSSLSGRGAEILFGEPVAIEVEPRGPLPEPVGPEPVIGSTGSPAGLSTPPPTAPAAADEETGLELALFEEAQDGKPGPGREEDLSVLEEHPPPTPEMESAFFSEAVVAEEPPEPVADVPIPTLEVTMEEKDAREEAVLFEAPPPETGDVTSGVLPPRPVTGYIDLGGLGPVLDVQGGGPQVKPLELPDRPLTEEEKKQLLDRLGDARIQELDRRIGEIYDQVLSRVGENEDLATECYNQLLKARDILLRRDAARIPQAEYYMEQVRARLKRAAESENGAKKYAWWIAGWGLFWFVAYITVLILLNYSWFRKAIIPTGTADSLLNMDIFLPAMVWGGIGGVACVFYSLFKHVGQRDFDTQYNLSYVGKPFLGVILGATVYMVVHLLIITLGILPAGLQGGEISTPTVAPWIIYLLAWASGFKENRLLDLVDRVMKRIFSGEEAAPAGPAAGPTPPPA